MLWYLIVAVDFFLFAALISKLRNITTLGGSPVLSNTGKWGLLIGSLLFFIPLSMLYFKLYPVSKPLHFIITLLLWLFTAHGVLLLAATGKMLCSGVHQHGVMSSRLQLMILPILITIAYWGVKQELQQSSLLNGWSILLMISISGASLLLWQLSLPWLYKLVNRAREGQR